MTEKLREAAQQALEALENATIPIDSIQMEAENAAIAALRSVLEEPEPVQEPVHQFRLMHSQDWYDGRPPDPAYGYGPYQTRTLYTAPPKKLAEPVQEPVACFIGAKGSAFDLPTTKRAYSYAEQPGNAGAYRLGVACIAAALWSAGDSIDRGLGLLKELQKQGFGVFDIGAEYVATPQQADPMHLMYIGLCDAIGYSARSDELQSPEEWAAQLYAHYASTTPTAEPVEPVGWIHGDEYADACHWVGGRMPPAGTNLYTTPPQRPPLSDEEIRAELRRQHEGNKRLRQIVEDFPPFEIELREVSARVFKIETQRDALLEALKLAIHSHNVVLTSYPPQDAWHAYRVDEKARAAIKLVEGEKE